MAKIRKLLTNQKDDMFFGVEANQGLEILPDRQVATLDFMNVYDRALAYLEKSPLKRLAKLDLREGAPSISVVMNAGELFRIHFEEESDEL